MSLCNRPIILTKRQEKNMLEYYSNVILKISISAILIKILIYGLPKITLISY